MSDQQFLFMFSSGSYSDYSVDGLYVCDHEVEESEWDAHYKAYEEEAARRFAPFKAMGIWEREGAPGLAEYNAWAHENRPDESFQKLHGMQPVGVSEFWRD